MRRPTVPLTLGLILTLVPVCLRAQQAARRSRTITAGDLRLVVRETDHGIGVQSLFDAGVKRELSAADPLPLFTLTLHHMPDGKQVRLGAETGWRSVQIQAAGAAGKSTGQPGLSIRWLKPQDDRMAGLQVEAQVRADSTQSALHWHLRVKNESKQWSLWRVVFPQLALADLGEGAAVLVPQGPGRVHHDAWRKQFRFQGRYPSGWTTMQFLAAYDAHGRTGLYVAVHDPLGGIKTIGAGSDPKQRVVRLRFDHPAPDMGKAGNRFELAGQAVWQLLRGDWYDAALTYRSWVRGQARWFPPLGPDGRSDTPQWMRELSVWAVGGGAPAECVPAVKRFAKFLGVPTGFHWYNWHQIPFDNDYPHYFPTKKGFAEGVKELQAAGVYVMPYINGRLWDTRDKGMEDFEFSRLALPAATKNQTGKPYTESYASKEQDGSRVKLAVMCPTTRLWQDRVGGIVLRLLREYHLNGVYIDQVAAAAPRLCFDPHHSHPAGGGHWWTEGYWRLLSQLRSRMPDQCMITTECSAEPYARYFDAYLTWDWQYDGQVPAFPAVYGGAVQMFGRAYRGGPTKELALRMKAGQQLVFGEQIGWISPAVLGEKDSAEFLRQVVRLRWRLRRYFYAGQMARPPRLLGKVPAVKADWRWSGTWPVTTDAVLTGAWQLPAEHKLAMLFVNVTDKAVKARLEFKPADYGLEGRQLRPVTVRPQGAAAELPAPNLDGELSFPPRAAWAIELTADGRR